MSILVTGCAGFIGSHLCDYILKNNLYKTIYGLDNLDPYYNIDQKKENLKILNKYENFIFLEESIINTDAINKFKPDIVCHLGSLAGVRNSIENPIEYAKINILGMINLLEQSKDNNITNFVFASSSSVYGLNIISPFTETQNTDLINSPYAASKKTMEIYGKLYNQLYDMNIIGLRFFTVYGPRGRPDMAPYKFLNSIINNKPITKYGNGETFRDYTYIDDIISGIIASLKLNDSGFKIYNLGNNTPITLNQFIDTCEKVAKKKAIIKLLQNQKGDVPCTYADITLAKKELNYNPKTSLEDGLTNLFNWLNKNN